jgi:hypothetical protein
MIDTPGIEVIETRLKPFNNWWYVSDHAGIQGYVEFGSTGLISAEYTYDDFVENGNLIGKLVTWVDSTEQAIVTVQRDDGSTEELKGNSHMCVSGSDDPLFITDVHPEVIRVGKDELLLGGDELTDYTMRWLRMLALARVSTDTKHMLDPLVRKIPGEHGDWNSFQSAVSRT